MSACCCSLAGTAACQTCSQNPYAVMSKLMTPQPTALRDIIVNPKPQTNADRIRAMSDEELAEMMARGNCGYCKIHDYCFSQKGVDCDEAWLDWLKAPVEVEE